MTRKDLGITALEAYIKERHPTATETKQSFLNANGDPITRYGIRYVTRKYGAQAQAKPPSIEAKPLNSRRIRHTTAMHLLRAGNDINMVSYWSRRINDEHRIVYKFFEKQLFIAQLRYHY